MGRLAELFEKKANGTITDEELKEYKQLQKEAAEINKMDIVGEEDVDKDPVKDPDEEADAEKAVDKLAQRFADSVTNKMDAVLKSIEDKTPVIETHQSADATYIVDAKLGKKTVGELGDIKIAIPERKNLGKKIQEVSAKTCHFVNALLTNNVEKLQLLSGGTPGDGGYLVPEEFANMIVEDIRDINIMRQIAAPAMTITTDTLHIPTLTSRPYANWRSEKAVKATSTASFSEAALTPYSLAAIVGLSNELAADASLGVGGSVVNYIAGLMAVSLNEKEEKAFWVGSGSGQPSGVDGGVYSSIVTVAAGAGASDAKRADTIVSMFQRLSQGYRNRGVWVANSQTWEEIGRLKDSYGQYMLTNLASSPTQTLRGRPVYEENNLAGGTLLFGDFSFYQIVDREGVNVRVSDEATVASYSAFERNLTFVRVEKRVDAELLLQAAVIKGTGFGTI